MTKTIGDAVMAVFSRPTDAVSAALQILGDIERYNAEHGDPSIILKIGAHCGPSIAVTLNENLDYFGQTVNVAARVQALADAGDICLSEALYSAPGVRELLAGHDVVAFDAPLRGVEGNACVYRVIGRRRESAVELWPAANSGLCPLITRYGAARVHFANASPICRSRSSIANGFVSFGYSLNSNGRPAAS